MERGGKLIAQGSQSEPIVFTSAGKAGVRRPGDWGGVIICGKARNNQTEMIIEGGLRRGVPAIAVFCYLRGRNG